MGFIYSTVILVSKLKTLTEFGRKYYYLIDKGYVYDNKLNKMLKNRK